MSLAVTAAGAEAAPLLAAIHAEGIGEAGPAWDETAFAQLLSLPGRLALVAADESEPAGIALLGVATDEAELLTLAVLPGFRRRGVGRALVTAVVAAAEAAGAVRLFLEVAEDNLAARALYAALGLSEAGRRRGYYARPGGAVDALLLARTLSPSSCLSPSS